jgi:hypothetical protein
MIDQLPLGVEIDRVDTKLSVSGNTAIAVVTLTTGFEMVGSSQFALDVVDPTPEAYKALRVVAVLDAIENICNIDSQPKATRELFYDLLSV